MASWRFGFGFLVEDVPNIRFMVMGRWDGRGEGYGCTAPRPSQLDPITAEAFDPRHIQSRVDRFSFQPQSDWEHPRSTSETTCITNHAQTHAKQGALRTI